MTKLRTTFLAAMASAVVATSFFASFDSAQAFPREGMKSHGHARHGGHGYRGHRGGFGHVGTGLAIGLGAVMIGQAIAAAQEEPPRQVIVRPRYKKAMQKKRVRKGDQMTAQQKRDCDFVKQWADLVKSAEDLLARDKQLHAQYGEAVHSIEHVEFQEKELERRREELRKAKEACNRHAAR